MLDFTLLVELLVLVRIVITVLIIYTCLKIYRIINTKGIAFLLIGQLLNILIRLGILIGVIPNDIIMYDVLGILVTFLSLLGFFMIYKDLKKNLKM